MSGGLAVGYGILETTIKEAAEEASVEGDLVKKLVPAGCVRYIITLLILYHYIIIIIIIRETAEQSLSSPCRMTSCYTITTLNCSFCVLVNISLLFSIFTVSTSKAKGVCFQTQSMCMTLSCPLTSCPRMLMVKWRILSC